MALTSMLSGWVIAATLMAADAGAAKPPKLPPRIGLLLPVFSELVVRGDGPDIRRYHTVEANYDWEILTFFKKPQHRLTGRWDVFTGVTFFGPDRPLELGTTGKFAYEFDTSPEHRLHAEFGGGLCWHTADTPNHQSRGFISRGWIGLGTEAKIATRRFIFWVRGEHRSNGGIAIGYGRLAFRPERNFQNDGIDYPVRFVAQMILD